MEDTVHSLSTESATHLVTPPWNFWETLTWRVSGRLVLTHMTPVRTEAVDVAEKRVKLVKTRTHSWGDQKLVESMVPGYKGKCVCSLSVFDPDPDNCQYL